MIWCQSGIIPITLANIIHDLFSVPDFWLPIVPVSVIFFYSIITPVNSVPRTIYCSLSAKIKISETFVPPRSFLLNKRLFASIIKIVLIVTLSVAAIATIVVLSKCVELRREGIYIDLTPLFDIV